MQTNEWEGWDQAEIQWQKTAYEREQQEEWESAIAAGEEPSDGLVPNLPNLQTLCG
jgi:hypothetical protein